MLKQLHVNLNRLREPEVVEDGQEINLHIIKEKLNKYTISKTENKNTIGFTPIEKIDISMQHILSRRV